MKKLLVLTIFALLFTSAEVFSQSRHYNSMSLGMGGGGTAIVDGYHANFINPANLMINPTRKRPKRNVGILGGIGLRAGGTLINIDVYNEYLTKGLTIEGQVAEDMLTDWFGADVENTRDFSTTANIIPFGFSNRGKKSAISVATRIRVTEKMTVNRGLAELGVYGIDPNKFGSRTPVNFDLGTIAFTEVSVGYARQILSLPNLLFAKDVKLYAGIAPKYLIGVQYMNLDFNSDLLMEQSTVNGEQVTTRILQNFNYRLDAVGALAQDLRAFERANEQDEDAKLDDYLVSESEYADVNATGWGFDMGATLEMDISGVPIIDSFFGKKKTLRVSMSLTDLGSMTFDKTPVSIFADGQFDYSGAGNDDEPGDYFEELADSLMNDVYGDFDSEETTGYKYELPAMYNFGASLVMGKLTTTLDYGVGFNEKGNNSKRSSMNLGVEYRLLGFIPIRGGTRVGGYSSQAYSAGIGIDLNFLEFSVAGSFVGNNTENGGSVAAAWSGLVLRF